MTYCFNFFLLISLQCKQSIRLHAVIHPRDFQWNFFVRKMKNVKYDSEIIPNEFIVITCFDIWSSCGVRRITLSIQPVTLIQTFNIHPNSVTIMNFFEWWRYALHTAIYNAVCTQTNENIIVIIQFSYFATCFYYNELQMTMRALQILHNTFNMFAFNDRSHFAIYSLFRSSAVSNVWCV